MFKKKNEEIISFVSGEIVAIDTVNDQVFSQKLMGDGFAIIPNENKFYAPVSGKVSAVFPTGHAIGITTKKGVEVLLHLGINTVELDGKGFTLHVEQGQSVKQGDLLVEMDLDLVKEAGYDTTSMFILTSGRSVSDLKVNHQTTAKEAGIVKVK